MPVCFGLEHKSVRFGFCVYTLHDKKNSKTWRTSMLHFGAQTSSPSYLLLASLDAARAAAQRPGAWDAPLEAARQARAGLRALPGLVLLDDCAAAGAQRTRRLAHGNVCAYHTVLITVIACNCLITMRPGLRVVCLIRRAASVQLHQAQ